jgi:hypothetical protein
MSFGCCSVKSFRKRSETGIRFPVWTWNFVTEIRPDQLWGPYPLGIAGFSPEGNKTWAPGKRRSYCSEQMLWKGDLISPLTGVLRLFGLRTTEWSLKTSKYNHYSFLYLYKKSWNWKEGLAAGMAFVMLPVMQRIGKCIWLTLFISIFFIKAVYQWSMAGISVVVRLP